MRNSSMLAATVLHASLIMLSTAPLQAQSGRAVIEKSGVPGGLVVHVDCRDGELTAQLRATERYTVQGLTTQDPGEAREHIRSRKGLYGPVSVRQWQGGSLPYADDLVNLVVVSTTASEVDGQEVARVLAPGGVAMIRGTLRNPPSVFETRSLSGLQGWTKYIKAWPEDMDQWTHYLHGSDNNAVSKDTRIGPMCSRIPAVHSIWRARSPTC
ncbi:MAG: class I SAM-dependent methyltransferase [Planctomycetota bacterium]